MKELNFPDDFNVSANVAITFAKHLVGKFADQPVRVFVNRVRYNPDQDSLSAMEYVNIDFQVFEEGQSGTGAHYTWEAHRSVNNGTGNYRIKCLTAEEVRAAEIEFLSKAVAAYTAEELTCNKKAYTLMLELTARLKEVY